MPSDFASHFGVNNIPYGIASSGTRPSPQCVTRIRDDVLFLADLAEAGAFKNISEVLLGVFRKSTLNSFASLSKSIQSQVRSAIQNAYKENAHTLSSEPIANVTLHLPIEIGDFTDFSASKDHVLNASEAMMGVRSYPPAFYSYPSAYAGRSSSIAISGSTVARPLGQFVEDYSSQQQSIIFGPCKALDYELEIGAIIGKPVLPETLLKAKDADEHIFGLVLVNDWSARDIQALEMNPLGPFNGKNFKTLISPWIITTEALEPYKIAAPPRMNLVAAFMDDPSPVNYKIDLEVELVRNRMSTTTCKVNFDTMYWTFRHMLAHHTVGGCGLRTGDLIASGTVSGEKELEHGCLLELTMNAKKPFTLRNGTELGYLEDGDIVTFTGVVGSSDAGIGFGECIGEVVPAKVP